MNAVLYKDFSDASECIVIQEGVPLYKSVDCEKRRVIVNGQESSGDYIPKQGDVILIRSIPGELVTVSLIVLAVLTVGAGIYAGIQAYQARKQADELTERMKNMSESATNIPNLRGASNSMAKGKTQPYIIGEHLFTPYLLTSPHYEITGTDGADQYYYAVLEGGFNNQIIRKISADDITLKTFSDSSPQEGSFTLDAGIFYDADARVEISQDGNAFAEAHFNAVYATQSPGAELKKADADDYEDLIYSLPQNTRDFTVTILFRGLRGYADDGSKVNRTVVVKPYYSLNSGSTWTEFTFNQNGTPSNTFTRNEAKEMRFVASAFPSYASVKDLTEPVLIKLVCETNTSTTGAMDQVYVQYVRSRLYDVEASKAASAFVNEKPIADTEADLSTRIGVKIKASLSNQDKLGKINVITSGVARTWTGSAWTTAKTATSNLAAWMLEVLTSHTHGPSQVDDSEIDLDAFGAFYTYCDTEEINVNHVLMDADEKTNVLSMLCDIGGAMLYENIYGEISVAVDAIKENSIAVLNTQNLLSFEVEREFSRETDGIRVSYISSEAGYQQDSYLVMRDGVTRDADSIIRDVNVQGITDYEQIVKYTRRLMAIEKLRPRTIRASVGKEGIYYTPLSKVQVQHPALSNGVGSAEIKSVIVEAGNITGLELYEPVLYDSGDTFGAIIQCVGADYCTPLAVQYVGDNGRNTIIELSTPISTGAAVIPHAGDTLSYGYIVGGEFDTITSEMLIIGIEPTETGYALTLVDYNEAIYDAGSIPDYIPRVTYVPPAVSAPVGLTPATLDDVNNTVVTPLTTAPATPASLVALAVQDGITLLAAPGGSPGLDNSAAYYHYQISRDGGLTWPGDWTAAAQAEYRFNRDVDGYPDSMSLYRARVKAVSAAGVESVSWLTVSVSGTEYLGWTPVTPGLSGHADARTAQLRLVQASGYYGHSRFEIQVQKDGDSSWYAPGDDGAARDSETAYRGTVDGYATAYADTFAQTLPLTNQAAGLPVNTSYLYRIRAVVAKPTTAAPDAVARSAWTSAITVVAKPTGTVDLVAKAVKTAQLDESAVTLEKLNVLAKNLANDLTDDSNGTTGWTKTLSAGTFDRVLDSSVGYKVGRYGPGQYNRIRSDSFVVGPNDIVEIELLFRTPTSAAMRPYLGDGNDGGAGELYEKSEWDSTAKSWGAFSGSLSQIGIVSESNVSASTEYKKILTYIVGSNVPPDKIPAPENDYTSATFCARAKQGTAKISVYVATNTGDLYFFAPSARNTAGGLVTAKKIVTPNLSAISATAGRLVGDSYDRLVMGDGFADEDVVYGGETFNLNKNGTFITGWFTDPAYFMKLWSKGAALWKAFFKAISFYVSAGLSTFLGIFRVRNSADTSTVFEVDPVNEAYVAVPFRRRANFVTATTGASLANYFGKVARVTISGQFQNVTLSILATAEGHGGTKQIARQIRFRVKQQSAFGSDPFIEAVEIKEAPEDSDRYRFYYQIVQNSGPTIVDVYVKILQTYTTVTGTIEHETDRAKVVFYSNQTLVSSVSGSVAFTQYRSVTEDSAGLTTLADVEADSVAVDGAVSAASASVSGNAQVGSLNGATPGGGGLELLQQPALGDGWAGTLANSVRLSGLELDGSSLTKTLSNPSIAKYSNTQALLYSDGILYAMLWSGSSWSQNGATYSFTGGRGCIAVGNNLVIAVLETSRQIRHGNFNGTTFTDKGLAISMPGSSGKVAACHIYSDVVGRYPREWFAIADAANGVIRIYSATAVGLTDNWTFSLVYSQSVTGLSSGRPVMAKTSDNNFALFNYGTKTIRVYWWSGAALFSANTPISFASASEENALCAFSSGILGFHECATNTFHTVSFSGAAFKIIDSSPFSFGSSVGLAGFDQTHAALASASNYLRMYKRTVGGVPYVSRNRTNWGPIYSLAFDIGATHDDIYTAITDFFGTSERYVAVFGTYGTGDVALLYITGSNTIQFRNSPNTVNHLVVTGGSSTTITSRLAFGFAI